VLIKKKSNGQDVVLETARNFQSK